MCKQVKFRIINKDVGATDEILGGIGIYKEDIECNENLINVICGCCGGMFEPEDIEILEVYKYWINISEEIIDGNHW